MAVMLQSMNDQKEILSTTNSSYIVYAAGGSYITFDCAYVWTMFS